MRELPMLLNGEMVRATLDGRKTQTRRPIMRHAPEWVVSPVSGVGHWRVQADKYSYMSWLGDTPDEELERAKHFCKGWNPLGVPGDLLYVRETFAVRYTPNQGPPWDSWTSEQVLYRASGDESSRWYPSIHMPKEYARLWLRNTGVRVERIQDITEEDVIAEGIHQIWEGNKEYWESEFRLGWSTCPFEAYAWLWDSIYAKSGLGWEVNPFVFVTTYEVMGR